ncbi:hypothetical protein I3760_15G102500 [Carya illinoinensis]|nr:hypothetical protein I3760_15G102500 [Carya illinoinensis]
MGASWFVKHTCNSGLCLKKIKTSLGIEKELSQKDIRSPCSDCVSYIYTECLKESRCIYVENNTKYKDITRNMHSAYQSMRTALALPLMWSNNVDFKRDEPKKNASQFPNCL